MSERLLGASSAALLTDFYELTMMAGYQKQGRASRPAVFEAFFRQLPHHSGFCLFAGLDDLLNDLEGLHFDEDAIHWLASLKVFPDQFIDYLRDFRFHGEVWAPPEGTPVFPNEPLVRVKGTLSEGQLVETLLLNRINFQTLIATKTARVCYAAEGDPVVEFGLRRAQEPDGGYSATRASYIGGCVGTSNILAAKMLGIPVSGTMAHSWVMSYPDEKKAFEAYMDVFPVNPVLLIDTYDTAASGLPNAVEVFKEYRKQGWTGRAGIRLDSGDLALLSKLAHQQLTAAGFADPAIVASNALDEDLIADLKRQGAKVNAWGVGTQMITGGQEPALGGVYKLAALEYKGQYVSKMKVSSNPEKTTDPGVKSPVRFYDMNGMAMGDVLFQWDEPMPEGAVRSHDRFEYARVHTFPASLTRRPLLQKMMEDGKRTSAAPSLAEVREYAQKQLETLRPELRRLRNPERYWVGLSEKLANEKAAELMRLTGDENNTYGKTG